MSEYEREVARLTRLAVNRIRSTPADGIPQEALDLLAGLLEGKKPASCSDEKWAQAVEAYNACCRQTSDAMWCRPSILDALLKKRRDA